MGNILSRSIAAVPAILLCAATAAAQSSDREFGAASAGVTYGPYFRAELGAGWSDWGDASWLPPGPADPRVFFDLGNDSSAHGGVALGFDRMDGFRFEVSLTASADRDATGSWS